MKSAKKNKTIQINLSNYDAGGLSTRVLGRMVVEGLEMKAVEGLVQSLPIPEAWMVAVRLMQ